MRGAGALATRPLRRPHRIAFLALIPLVLAGGLAPDGVAEDSGAPAHAVVLLHGLGRRAIDLAVLATRLEARGFRVCNIDYESRVDSIEIAAAEVSDGIRACGLANVHVDFVTHSLGALVLRALYAGPAPPRGRRAVLLAPPNGGSEIVERLRGLTLFDALLGPLASQLGTDAADLPSRYPPPPIPFAVIAGDRWINPLGALWLPAPHDGTVSVASTRLTGMSDHLVLPYTHTFIPYAEPVADAVEAFLRTGRFIGGAGGGPP